MNNTLANIFINKAAQSKKIIKIEPTMFLPAGLQGVL